MARPFVSRCVWLAAVTFVPYFVLLVYCDIARPEGLGYRATIISGRMVVSNVGAGPDTPAGRAGLRTGDIIVAADGRRIATFNDWTRVEGNVEYNRPIQLTIQRGSTTFARPLVLSPAGWDYWITEPGLVLLTALGIQGRRHVRLACESYALSLPRIRRASFSISSVLFTEETGTT